MLGEAETWSLRKLHPRFGAELTGQRIDGALSPSSRQVVVDAIHRFGVVVIPSPDLTDDDLQAFTESIGRVHGSKVLAYGAAAVARLTNLDEAGNILPPTDKTVRMNDANELWHTDSTYLRPRASISMLHARVIPPEGGTTEYCDTRCAYEDLTPARRAELAGLIGAHSLIHSRALTGYTDWTPEQRQYLAPIDRPLVHLHAETGRMALCIAAHIGEIKPLAPADGERLLQSLIEAATVPQSDSAHEWRVGDLLLWDNRCTMHRARPFDQARYGRDMRTIRVDDEMEL